MSRVLSIVGANAKSGGAVSYTKRTQNGSVTKSIVLTFREIFPRKTWAAVADMLGLEERTAKHRLRGTRRFSDDEIAELLRSEDGLKFLAAIMGDAKPRWWRGFLAHIAAGNARRAMRAQEQLLREAISAVESVGSAVSQADAALAFQDEDFMRPHVDAMRAVTRVPHSAMAQKRGR